MTAQNNMQQTNTLLITEKQTVDLTFFFFFNSPREQKGKKVKDRGVEIGK